MYAFHASQQHAMPQTHKKRHNHVSGSLLGEKKSDPGSLFLSLQSDPEATKQNSRF